MNLSRKIIDWSYFGTNFSNNESVKRHIIFSNVVFLTLPIVYFVFIFIDLDSYLEPGGLIKFDLLIVPIMIVLCIGFLMMNKYGYITFSRVLFLFTWLLLLHIIPIIVHHTPSDYYLAFPVGIIFHSVLIHVSLSSRNESVKFWLFIALNFVVMLSAREILVMNDSSPASQNVLRNDPYFILDTILYWLLFNLVLYYVLYVVDHYIRQMAEANSLITLQRKELAEKNEELEQLVSSLQDVNQHVEDLNKNLEHKVAERTIELKLNNDKLAQYAYINAHLLRGPFCRVKGLILLKDEMLRRNGSDEKIDEFLIRSLDELDEVTTRIQEAVELNEETKNGVIQPVKTSDTISAKPSHHS